MSEFSINVGSAGRYNIMGTDEQIPVTVTWSGGSIKAYLDAADYDAEDLRREDWRELALFIADHIATKYLYHGDSGLAKELLTWLDDDPEDEHRIEIEEAEQEWLLPRAKAAVERALSNLTWDNRARVLDEVVRR